MSISKSYDQLCNLIIRPPRVTYDLNDLGPLEFKMSGKPFVREDVEVHFHARENLLKKQILNSRGLSIQGSFYRPKEQEAARPVVIYCHGNCGCRIDALDTIRCLLGFSNIFTLDFSGCGLSEGEYISLGYWEKQDLAAVVEWLRATSKVSTIGLWGRSMGAATSIFYAADDASVAGMVLDSCYSSLRQVSEELVDKLPVKLPKFMLGIGLKLVRSSIKSRAKFDINELEPIKVVSKCFIPALFVHGNDDNFILPHHTERLHAAYAGDKNIVMVEGDHNSVRPDFLMDSIAIFFHNTLVEKSGISTGQIPTGPTEYGNPYEMEMSEEDELRMALAESLRMQESNYRQEREDFFDDQREFAELRHDKM